MPLWQAAHADLVGEFLAAGFAAMIVTVDLSAVPESFLGRDFSAETVAELEARGVDPSGEGGEFHTVVLDGPIFRQRVPYEILGIHRAGNHATLELR